MNVSTKLYDLLRGANVQESIYLATEILLENPEKNIDMLQNTLVYSCSYIGSFVSFYDIRLWLEVVHNVVDVVESEKLLIHDVYVIITKICILCDIHIKRPRVRAGMLNIKLLRPKIIDLFSTDSVKLSSVGIAKFEGILPPPDSPSYELSIQIITGLVSTLRSLDTVDYIDTFNDLAEKTRQSFDYITRKRYQIETSFYDDSDSVWFLWGLICMLYHDEELDMLYRLFSVDYSKRVKQQRIGLLWGAGVVVVYLKKRSASRDWNSMEMAMIKKIGEVALIMYNDIKRQISDDSDKPAKSVVDRKVTRSIDFLNEYVPKEGA